MNLTHQQEKFAQGIASGLSQADAYRAAYPKSKKWKVDAIYSTASQLAADPKVSQRIQELRKPIVEAAQLTLSEHLGELARLKLLAEVAEQLPAAIRAEELRGKASGHYIERKEVGDPGAFSADKDELRKKITDRSVRLGLVKVVPIKKDVKAD